jgi:hypothetical protein
MGARAPLSRYTITLARQKMISSRSGVNHRGFGAASATLSSSGSGSEPLLTSMAVCVSCGAAGPSGAAATGAAVPAIPRSCKTQSYDVYRCGREFEGCRAAAVWASRRTCGWAHACPMSRPQAVRLTMLVNPWRRSFTPTAAASVAAATAAAAAGAATGGRTRPAAPAPLLPAAAAAPPPRRPALLLLAPLLLLLPAALLVLGRPLLLPAVLILILLVPLALVFGALECRERIQDLLAPPLLRRQRRRRRPRPRGRVAAARALLTAKQRRGKA